jgi:hypothetical protein
MRVDKTFVFHEMVEPVRQDIRGDGLVVIQKVLAVALLAGHETRRTRSPSAGPGCRRAILTRPMNPAGIGNLVET